LQGDVVETRGYSKPYVEVPQGHCWVEGDHTGHSLDSNIFGPVALGLIKSKAKAIVWPPSRIRVLEKIPVDDRIAFSKYNSNKIGSFTAIENSSSYVAKDIPDRNSGE